MNKKKRILSSIHDSDIAIMQKLKRKKKQIPSLLKQ
jgi:hypothetical protein